MTRYRKLRRGRAVALAAALAMAASGCGISLQSLPQVGGSGHGGYDIHAIFTTVASLAPNAEVRVGDAVVGRVSSITARNYQAVVTMQIDKGTVLPVGTTASALFSTPLGDEYVSLSLPKGGGAPLPAGATLDAAHTNAAPTVADTLAALGTVLYGSGLGQAETVTSELNTILGGRGPEIRQLLADIDTTVSSFAGNDPSLDNALTSVGAIAGQLNAGSADIVAALDTLPQAADTLNADNASLQKLLTGVDQLGPAVQQLIRTSGNDLVADSQALAPVAAQLATIQDHVGTDLADLRRVITDAGKVAPDGYIQGAFAFNAYYPDVSCTPHVVPAAAPDDCNALYPSSNQEPPQGLSTTNWSSPGAGPSADAVAEMGRALP